MTWSVAGARRSKHGDPNAGDDAFHIGNAPSMLILAVADGAGSADLGGVGADIACRTVVECSPEAIAESGDTDPAVRILAAVREAIDAEALKRGVPSMALATTLLAAVLFEDRAFLFQIGDGAIVYRTFDAEHQLGIVPEETEFVNTTYFVTSPDAGAHLQSAWVPRRIEEVALFSDGIQHLVLHPTDQRPHEAFFSSVFRTLREPGTDAASAAWLENMLGSDMVTRRTDDDTSILIARRLD